MSKAWSVNRPGNSVTQLNPSLQRKDGDQQTEHLAKPGFVTKTEVRLSPVQQAFWEKFRSERDRKVISSGAFTQVGANDEASAQSSRDKKQIFNFPKIVEK